MNRVLLCGAFCLAVLAQEFASTNVGKIGAGYRFTEGAAWSKDGFVVFSDTPNDKLLKWVPGHAAEVFRENAHGPSGNAFDALVRVSQV